MSGQSYGVWVWYPNSPSNDFDDSVVNKLQMMWDSGVRRLYLKGSDGIYPWQVTKQLANLIKSEGWEFSLWAWHYSYEPAVDEAVTLSMVANAAPWDGLVLDIETEYKNLPALTANESTKDFIVNVRNAWNGRPVWVSSFALPQYHQGMPWRGLSEADGFMPQLFPGYQGIWKAPIADLLNQCALQHSDHVGDKPIIPCWETYNELGGPMEPERMKEILATVDHPTIDFFRWGKMGEELWQVLREHDAAAIVPPHDGEPFVWQP